MKILNKIKIQIRKDFFSTSKLQQHLPCFFYFVIVGSIFSYYEIFIPTVVSDISPLSIFFIMFYAKLLNAT